MFRLGYNTNGLAHHRLLDALQLVAELGYEALAITPDVGQLDLAGPRAGQVADVKACSQELGVELAIETGARFVLDPRRKHFPSLLEEAAADRGRRLDYLRRAVDLAAELEASIVSIWAGVAPSGAVGDDPDRRGQTDSVRETCWQRLCEGVSALVDHARGTGVTIGFEPEPGMFLERPAGYGELIERLGSRPAELGMTLDVGHCLVTRDLPVPRVVAEWAPHIVHVHLDDIAGGVHEHCMFGSGELDLPGTLNALIENGYAGMAAVELSRDSHRGAAAAEEALGHLQRALSRA